MTVASRVYVARLAGIAVFDPNGDQVGRVRDVLARARTDGQPSRVLGLISEIPAVRRIFIPMGRVTVMDADAVVLSTGTLSLRRFAKRTGELLVIEELLDRRVVLPDGRKATVVDVAMEKARTGDWLLSRVAVREYTGRLSRRGNLVQLDWAEVPGLTGTPHEQGTDALIATMDNMRAADVANVLQDLDERRRFDVAAALNDERLADVLQELPEHDQVEILTALDKERAADVLEEMDPDDAADLLHELPEPDQAELLGLMEPEEAQPVRQLLEYSPGTAGSLMTSEPVVLTPDTSIAEALAMIRVQQLAPAIAAQVFVTRSPTLTPTGKYLGVAHFQSLLREPPADLVGGIVDNDIDPLTPETPILEVTRRMATYNLVAMPVVDDAGRLLGAVTVDDLLDHLLPSDWRDRERHG
ncbi:magnesium transporter MgtE N-terminal domain-containing protein [Longispora albida]|uniref:magnesium transporter MgtE N-terminal domain-containing protein n=1 Tax=Longispora albida TaxID=203523 RepID=UPI000688B980|nr:CBS domain-containing protein [Longispora albida]